MNLPNKITKSVLAVGLLGLLSLPLTALAVPVTLTMEGTTSMAIGTTPIGSPWSASVMYDTAVLPTSSGVNFAKWTDIPTFVYSFTVGAETFTYPPLTVSTTFIAITDNNSGFDFIAIGVTPSNPFSIGGVLFGTPWKIIIGGPDTMLSGFLSLPLTADFSPLPFFPLLLPDFDGDITLGPGESIQLEVGSNPIPEPSTMLLFGTGLAGMVAWRFKKQYAKN